MSTDIERWTIQIADRVRTVHRDFTESLVEIGTLLQRVRRAMKHGDWLAWLREMPFAQRSAANYMLLAKWAFDRPREFQRLKSLGPSKLYAIARLDGRRLRGLRPGRIYEVPGTGRRRSLERMSVPELYALVAAWTGDVDPRPSMARVVASYRQRLTRLLRATTLLLGRKAEVPPGTLQQLRNTLREIAREMGIRTLARAGPHAVSAAR